MCDPILVTLLKMRLYESKFSRKNATTSSGTPPSRLLEPLKSQVALTHDPRKIGGKNWPIGSSEIAAPPPTTRDKSQSSKTSTVLVCEQKSIRNSSFFT